MLTIRSLRHCSHSLAVWFGASTLVIAGYTLHRSGELISQSWAQERGQLTSRGSLGPAGEAGSSAPAALEFGESVGDERTNQLMREGARIVNQPVTCRGAGDRLLVELPQSAVPIVALENLASQRILKSILDDIGGELWLINGSITEFQGRNYILLDRVTRQANR